jgi:zinc protease
MKKDFARLPAGAGTHSKMKPPAPIESTRATIIDKDTRSVAYSIGFPIDCTRISPDYPALLLATTYFGQHRMSGGVLYDRMREQRGLNYGDYAYLEYFPRGMFLMEPQPNLPRQSQIFQIWIRPVEPPTAVFALRLALYELDKLVKDGIPQDGFDRTREFLTKYVNVLTRTKRAELGYAIDSLYYGVPNYNALIKTALAKMTREDVNRAIKRYLRTDKLAIVAVSKNAEGLKQKLGSGEASPMEYNSAKSPEIMQEDKTVEKRPLGLKAADISIKPVGEVFQ